MNIYISGISGTGMGPLALMAKQAGFDVCGSDLKEGAIYQELVSVGIEVEIGEQDGEFLRKKMDGGVDWFVYTSAIDEDHPELLLAKKAGIKCTKRDDLTAFLVDELGLKMVAVAGTHGKTTTTSMIVWTALKLGLPVSYVVGTTLGFALSGAYQKGDKYFVYEADEYDKNFLKYHPWLAVITCVSYDHADIYPSRADYEKAFNQFEEQSKIVIKEGLTGEYKLAGEIRRQDAGLAATAVAKMMEAEKGTYDFGEIEQILSEFPGVGRRFEKITDGVYTDYAHHPEEVKATVDVALDEVKLRNKKGVVVVYQPHQNTRQHEVKDGYREAFKGATKVFWLPTYLTRENLDLKVIKPEEFVVDLVNADVAETAELDDALANKLHKYVKDGYLVVLMTAGPADGWLRRCFGEKNIDN